MKTSFLGTAEARAEHLRELSHHVRSLNLASASQRDAEGEIPELETAMTVYRRLSPKGDGTFEAEPQAFLGLAEDRADHLRKVTEHLQALGRAEAELSEIDAEIPELELAMTVYRRLTDEAETTEETDDSRPAALAAPFTFSVNAAVVRPEADLDEPEAPAGSSFSQFAKRHLDPNGNQATEADAEATNSR
jgi:hypothetical protein